MLDLQSQPPFSCRSGSLPILVSIPHNGAFIPDSIATRMTPDGRSSRDTDWYLDRLYDLPETKNTSFIVANYSRYVLDLNRPRDNQSLYPGQLTTGLIPETCFDGTAIYKHQVPTEDEVAARIDKIWRPYHDKIQQELARMRDEHSVAVLLEAHSINSVVPRLFDGVLPEFNIGTNNGSSCDAGLTNAVVDTIKPTGYSFIVNGRFVGGYITRCYGDPDNQTHALQIELSQATYMNEEDLTWSTEKAARVQPVFRKIFQAIQQWVLSQ